MSEDTNSPFGFITSFLRDDESQDQLAIAAEQGNDLATEGFGRDLREMSYAGLVAKYGEDVAQNRFRIQDGDDRLREHRDDSSSLSGKVADTALDAAAGFISLSGNTVGALAVRPMAALAGVDPDLAAAFNADLTSKISGGFRGLRSDFAQENSRVQGIAAQLDAADSQRQFDADVDAGASEFTASLQQVGRDVLNAGSRIGQDPEAIREIIGGSLGSLGPSAALTRGSAMAVAKGVGLLTSSARAATIASSAAAVASIGATEASGTYAQTLNEVMKYDADILSASPVYAGLLEEGYTPDEARVQLANLTAEEAFLKNLPAAVALGVLTQRFETAPIGSFTGSGLVGGMRTIASQAVEEGGQGAFSALSQNSAVLGNVDETRKLTKGVGEQLVQGAIGGVGQAGVSAAPATAVGAARSIIGSAVEAGSAQTFNDPLTNEILGRDNIATRTAETIRGVTAPIRDRAQGADTQAENTAVEAARETVLAAGDAIQSGEASPEFTEAVTQPDQTPVPAAFDTVAGEGESLLGRVARVTEKLSEKRSKFSDSEAAYAGAQYAKLRGLVSSMPEAVRSKAVQMLQSPQAKAVETRLKKLDQNQVETTGLQITPDVVAETVALAETNPTNVNPEIATKILEESGESLSPVQTRILRSASKIASIVNDRQGKEVAISEGKKIGLTKAGKPTTKAKTIQEASRSLRVKGYTKSDGKTPLRSINDFASDIFQGAQSPDGTILSSEGTTVPVETVMNQFSLLVQHMNNKVGALNESFRQNNRKGTGPALKFDGLVGGEKLVPAAQWKGSPVSYHRNNPGSVEFARQVAADQDAAVQVYNELRAAFPDRFGSLPEVQSVVLAEDQDGYIDLESLNAEIDAQEAAEVAEAEAVAGERRLRKDAVLKTEESLIDLDDSQPAPVLDEVVDAEAATTEEQNQNEVNVDADPNDFDPFTEDEIKEIQEKEDKETQERKEKTGPDVWHGVSIYKDFFGLNPGDRPKISRQVDPDHFFFSYITTTGLEVAGHFTWKNNVITQLAIASESGPFSDNKGVRETFTKILNEFPKTNYLHGYRVSGARSEAQNLYFQLNEQSRLKLISKKTFIQETGIDPTVVEPEGENQNVDETREGQTPDDLETADLEVTDRDSNVDIDQGSDTIVDDDGNPIKFYHGTNADFDQFRDGAIFLTTRKGLAREHARRGEGGTPRLIETEVALGNPLTEQIPNDEDPDAYWLKNALTIQTAKENGGFDSIFLFNDNEGMIIADRNDQVTITNPDVDGTREEADQELNVEQLQEVPEENPDIHANFAESYQEDPDSNAPQNLDAYLEYAKSSATMNQNTVAFAEKLVRPMVRAMNTRLSRVQVNGQNLLDALKDDTVQTYRQYRNTAIVNKETGEYDQNLIELAGLAMIDWMASVQARDPNQLADTLEELGLSINDITDEQMEGVLFGVSVSQAKATLAKDILRMWGVRENVDAPLASLVGIAEGVAAEMITTVAENPNISLLEIAELPLTLEDGKPVTTATIIVKGLESVQDQIKNVQGENTNMLAREELFDVPKETYSIGTPITGVPVNQSRGNVRLSQLERTAVGTMQNTGHFKDEVRADLVMNGIGEDALMRIMGYTEDAENIENSTLRVSVEGKNTSIRKNIKDAFGLLNQVKDGETPVYYPVGVTKVGRHQYQGPNPQSNKLLRMLVTPTWSELDLNSKEDMDLFWLGIGQAAELHKIEKNTHESVLATVRDDFNKKYRTATDMVKAYLSDGEMNGEAFADAVGEVDPQVLAAIQSVAHMELSAEAGAESFRTSLSFELDGLTNGAANMMVNFGQGEFTKDDFHNFNRVGLFLGQIGKTVNQYFSARGPNGEKNLDLYEKTSGNAQANMYANYNKLKPEMRAKMAASARFAARFGNFEINEETGRVEMTRNTAKNPMTKVNYGSSVGGVGRGVADDMLVTFYRKIQGIPDNTDLETYFQYPGLNEDIRVLFGDTLPPSLGGGAFEFPASAVGTFQKAVSDTLGEILTGTTKNVIGDKITELNDMLVFSTNVQANYVKMIFRDKLEALAEKRAQEGKLRRNPKTQKPIISEMTRRDYNAVVKELEALSPIFVSDDQTLAVGGFQTKKSDFELSANMDGKLNQKSNLPMPEDVSVAAIPYSVIGTGDAMMMNFIFGSDDAPTDALGIFDGLDIPVAKMKEYGPLANKAVQKTWERDVLAMVTANFNGFLAKADPAVLEAAYQETKDKNKKTTVTAATPSELAAQLDERHRQNAARKAVLKRIPLSVDQMGGSDNGFTRGEEEMTLSQINREVERELAGKKAPAEDVKIEIQETTADAVLKSLRLSADQKKVVEILKGDLPGIRVIFGTISQMNDYRQENFPDDGQVLKSSASYDAANETIFLATTKTDTIIHEMVHAATYNKVLAHYEGSATNDAVTRLEALKDEFLGLDSSVPKVREAQAAILRQQAQNDPASQAAAVNEFMAYSLGNQEVSKTLKDTNTKTTVVIARKVLQLMRRLMGGVPATMFDNVVFNTKVLNETPVDEIDEGGNGSGDGGDGSNQGEGGDNGSTPITNFWIKTITDYIDQNFSDLRDRRRSVRPLRDLDKDADKIVDGYRQVGMLANREQEATFRAIYMVMRAEIKLEPTAVIGLNKIFKHVEENLTPDMFGNDREAPQVYSAVINSFDAPDSAAVLLALSQTSNRFRAALDQVPDPQGEAQVDGSLNQVMKNFGQMFMQKVMGNVDFTDKTTQEAMDELANGIVALDTRREYAALQAVTGTLTKADAYVSGKMSQLSNKVKAKNEEIKAESRSKFVKVLSNSITLGTNLLDKTNTDMSAYAAKRATHMNVPFLSLVPIREMVSEIVGTDAANKDLVAMQDKVNFQISGMRQAYREDLPGILQNLFTRPPEAEEWAAMHTTLGQTDFTKFVDPRKMQSSMQYLEEGTRRTARITQLEQALEANLLPYIAQDAKDKTQQLANYMNGNGAGKLLMRNAYAIVKNLDGTFQESMVEVVDELVTMYAIDQMDPAVREATVQLWQEDPKAVTGMVTYIQGLNEAEDAKVGISEQARLNGYKGFIPNHGEKDTRVIIDTDDNQNKLEKLGYTKLGPYSGDVDSAFSRSYYVSTTRQGGAYSQGIMQNVQSTYRGVDINTGLTVTGETSGFVSGDGQVERYIDLLNAQDYVQEDDKETMMPVFDEDGSVLGFERAINPDVYAMHTQPQQNLALMLGAWAGRHVEEGLAAEYNRALLDELDRIYKDRAPDEDDLFVNLKDTTDPIYRESFSLWPQSSKMYADGLFDGNGPMVRKDQVNLSTGYREFSVADFWSGKTRLPDDLANTVRNVSTLVLGKPALKILSQGEKITQGAVSTAKDIIVIRSLIVPLANTVSNVVQLGTRGVPMKEIVQGYRSKLAEIEEYNKNVTELIDLEAKLRLAANSANQRRIIQAKIKAVEELNEKMTIAPIIAAGAYKNLSEGITDLDVDITKGRFGDIMEAAAEKLPGRLTDMAKLGLVSKSTDLYKIANRGTQYGDFLAKSIYYDHLLAQAGLTQSDEIIDNSEAIAKMNEEFVNFTTLPGRVRSGLESFGLTWFMAFKIRIAKIAAQQLRDNPVRSLAISNVLPDVGSPVNDNIAQVIWEDRLDYATGYDMLFDAPSLNPWVNLLSD